MKIIGYLNYDYERLPDPHLLTHINFSFAELYVRNGVYDHFELCGQNIEKLINVVKLKEINPDLKVLISLTSQIHNEDNFQDGGFSAICNDSNQRQNLINDIISFIDKYNLDGVDLNWEFPCVDWCDQTPLPNDKENFNVFFENLRKLLPQNKILSYAGYVLAERNFNDTFLTPIADHVNVMCYDLGEGRLGQGHNSVKNNVLSCESSIVSYKNWKIEPQKYILGIPLYGRHSYRKGDKKIYEISKIEELLKDSEYHYSYTINNVPFLYKGNISLFSYENKNSLYKKIEMVYENNLGGIMIWNIAYDTKDFKYLKIINNIIKKCQTK